MNFIKLKRILTAVVLCVTAGFSNFSSAQQDRVFKLDPHISQGYVILEKIDSVEYWSVTINNLTLKSTDNNYKPVKAIVAGDDYLKMPENYDLQNDQISINVIGYTEGREIFISDEADINLDCLDCGPNFTEECYWVCNGQGYAYMITAQVNDQNSSSILQLETAYQDAGNFGNIPYYEYMSENQFNSQCNAFQSGGPGSCIIDNHHNIKITNPQIDYRNAQNNVISGVVYGVSKDRGPWEGESISTDEIATGDVICGNNINWAINQLNTVSGPFGQPNLIDELGLPDLECAEAFSPQGNSVESYDMNCINDLDWILGDPDDVSNNPDATPDGDIFDYLNAIQNCLDGSGGFDQWYEQVSQVSIVDLNGDDDRPIYNIVTADIFNKDGGFNPPVINLEKGLYSIATVTKDGQYLPIIKEVKSKFTSTVDLASLFTANLYPNPMTDDFIDIDMSSEVDLRFEFIVTDLQGNKYADLDFVLEKDRQRSVRVPLKGDNLPTGTLVGTFIFKDGSQKTYNIIRH